MPSLVATTSALARTPCVRTHYFRNNLDMTNKKIAVIIITPEIWPNSVEKNAWGYNYKLSAEYFLTVKL